MFSIYQTPCKREKKKKQSDVQEQKSNYMIHEIIPLSFAVTETDWKAAVSVYILHQFK